MITNENFIRMKLNKSLVNKESREAELFKSFLYDVFMKTKINRSSNLFQINTSNKTKERTSNVFLNNTSIQHNTKSSNQFYTNLFEDFFNFFNNNTFEVITFKMIEFNSNSKITFKSSKTSITSKNIKKAQIQIEEFSRKRQRNITARNQNEIEKKSRIQKNNIRKSFNQNEVHH